MKNILIILSLILVESCKGQKKPVTKVIHKETKTKIVYRDTTWWQTDVDTTMGYVNYRGISGGEYTKPGIKVHSQAYEMHDRLPHDLPTYITDSKGDTTGWFCSGASGIGDPLNSHDYYFISIDGHYGQIDNNQVIIFLKK
jgi:hypothetical protein